MLVAYPDKAYVSYPCSVASEYRGIPISINDECVAAIDPNLVAFPPAPKFLRGDVNNDGTLNITDPINILGFLFLGNPTDLQCEDAADANDSGNINITDSIHLLNYLFNPNPTHIYGDKVAIIIWGRPMYGIIIKSRQLADANRKYFKMLWNIAEKRK